MQHLNIALVQTNLIWENPEENRVLISKKIAAIPKHTDVVVLPEMFTTGFTMNPVKWAETMNGDTVQWMRKLASGKNIAIAGSIIVFENEAYYNRFLFVHPSGEIKFYNKRHLFTLAGEHKVYTQGNKKVIVNYKEWKICLMVCYDLRFPVWSRNKEDYDVLLYVANWPKTRIAAWDTLLKARAIENMCYAVGVNRVATDANNLVYNGHSAVYNSLGEEMLCFLEGEDAIKTIALQKEHLKKTREKLGFLKDRDRFTL